MTSRDDGKRRSQPRERLFFVCVIVVDIDVSMVHNGVMAYTDVFADSDSDRAIALRATSISSDTWNGWIVPIVTATEFARWLEAMKANDSAWEESTATTDGNGNLAYSDENGNDTWQRHGVAVVDGWAVSTYALSGWTWTL